MTKRVLLLMASLAIAGCGKDEPAKPAPVPTECWKGRKVDEKQARTPLVFCVKGEDAHKTTDLTVKGKPVKCSADGKVSGRTRDNLDVAFDAGSCESGRQTVAHRMSCRSAEGRSWACQFSAEAKQPGWWVFFPVAPDGK